MALRIPLSAYRALERKKAAEIVEGLPATITSILEPDQFKDRFVQLPDQKSHPPATFHPFTRLPSELRLLIWETQITARVVHYNHTAFTFTRLQYHSRVPVLLHVCQESRALALEHYVFCGFCRLYLHPKLDMLAWMKYPCPHGLSRRDIEGMLNRPPPHLPQKILGDGNGGKVNTFTISRSWWTGLTKNLDCGPVYRHIRLTFHFATLLLIMDDNGSWRKGFHMHAGRWLDIREQKSPISDGASTEWFESWRWKTDEEVWEAWDEGRIRVGERGELRSEGRLTPCIKVVYPRIVERD